MEGEEFTAKDARDAKEVNRRKGIQECVGNASRSESVVGLENVNPLRIGILLSFTEQGVLGLWYGNVKLLV